jgi:hypothetical protein
MSTNINTPGNSPTYYAMIIETLGGPEFTCKDENENPWIFLNEKAAWRDIVDSKICELNAFLKGDMQLGDCIFQNDLYPIKVQIDGNMIIGRIDEIVLVHEIIKGTELSFEDEGPL